MHSNDFEFLLQSDNESLMSEMQLQTEKGVTDCVSESRKRFENFPGFEKLARAGDLAWSIGIYN